MPTIHCQGDLLDQAVDAIVNPWNRNIIPWWLLLPQGVSGAIKSRAGYQPFIELGRMGPIPLGCARWTSAGRLPFRGLIHVAGINMWWRASPESVTRSVEQALALAKEKGLRSLAMPLIGAGHGGLAEDEVATLMTEAIERSPDHGLETRIVRFSR